MINEDLQDIPWNKVVRQGERPMTVKDPISGKVYNTNGQYEWKGTYWEAIM